eukprot:symbB.v1.2.001820.t1/scaffold97.1/size333048/24
MAAHGRFQAHARRGGETELMTHSASAPSLARSRSTSNLSWATPSVASKLSSSISGASAVSRSQPGLLLRCDSASLGIQGKDLADECSPTHHIGMAERPGPGYDFTSTGLSALRLPTQAAEAHVADFARSCALKGRPNASRFQRRTMPRRPERTHRENQLLALYKQSNPDAVIVSVTSCAPWQELLSAPQSAKYYALHQREATRFLRSAEQRSPLKRAKE